MSRKFTKYPSNIYASYPAEESEYSILVLTPDWELSEDTRIENRAIENKVFYLTRDLKNLPEVSSIEPAKNFIR